MGCIYVPSWHAMKATICICTSPSLRCVCVCVCLRTVWHALCPPMPACAPQEGNRLDPHLFQLGRRLGSGSFATVGRQWTACQPHSTPCHRRKAFDSLSGEEGIWRLVRGGRHLTACQGHSTPRQGHSTACQGGSCSACVLTCLFGLGDRERALDLVPKVRG